MLLLMVKHCKKHNLLGSEITVFSLFGIRTSLSINMYVQSLTETCKSE